MRRGRSQRQNESAEGKFRKKRGKRQYENRYNRKQTIWQQKEKSSIRAKCTRSKIFSENTGVSKTRGLWRTGERNTVQLLNLSFIFSLRMKKFFWDDEDMNTTFHFSHNPPSSSCLCFAMWEPSYFISKHTQGMYALYTGSPITKK